MITVRLDLFMVLFRHAQKYKPKGLQWTKRIWLGILVTTVDNFTRDRLINKEKRTEHKEQCAERLAAEDGSCDKDTEVRYSDQAVLANLDWGIEALEEAIDTSNMETKLARLEHAEKMLQVCALLNSNQKTAGVPNFYLSAWAHLNLSYMIDFAPELWKELFLSHMSSIVGWYSEERHRLVMDLIPDCSDMSYTADLDKFFNESSTFSMKPEQLEKLHKLEQVYGESLDENTRLFSKYYKDCMNSESTPSKKMIPMLPIAEPPMTPLHEVSRSIPDYVKFGPILPKSAEFSPMLKSKYSGSTTSQNLKESTRWDPQEGLLEENEDEDEDDSEYVPDDGYVDADDIPSKRVSLSGMKMVEEKETRPKSQLSKMNIQIHSPPVFSPLDSPTSPSPKISSPKPDVHHSIHEEGSQSFISIPISEKLTTRTRPTRILFAPSQARYFYPDLAQEFSYSETSRDSLQSPSKKEIPLASTLYRTSDLSCDKSIDYLNYRRKRFLRAVVSTSPTSVISQAAAESIINNLKPYGSCLSTSENLQECETAVLAIARLWKESKADPGVHSYLSNPTIVNGFVEILSASVSREVLRTSIYILSELVFADESVGKTLTSVDSDFDCLAALLKNGLVEAVVLIYQLTPAFDQLSAHDLIPSLVLILLNKTEELDDLHLVIEPKDAAIPLLEQILMGGDECSRSLNALSVISANGIPALVKCLDRLEGRRSIVSILLCCMQAEKGCRSLIANRIELSPFLELFHAGNDSQPAIAALLLQLDLQVEPREMSIYREEAIDILIEALRRKDFSDSQMMALDALLSLSGRLTSSGKSYIEAWLLKTAGFDQPYNALMKAEQLRKDDNDLMETMEEEEKAASSWERRVAFVLCNHENSSIFKALEECLKSDSLEMAKSCLVLATWLTHMLSTLPHTGVRDAARKSLLDEFINVLQSSKNLEEKILVSLAMKTFVSDPFALEALGVYAKCIYKTLRKLMRNSSVVRDIMEALMKLPSVDATDLWSCSEMVELDSCPNGEVLSLLHLNGWLLSSHSDGTIKVWDVGKRVSRLIQEVHEHTKAVTCLYVSSSGEKLYSGSFDKTIRVWAIKPEEIHCIQVHDVKEAVYDLTANSNVACYVTHGTGVKASVYKWSGVPKHINFNKYVKCLAMTRDKLYCGCSGYSIQEVDLCKYTTNTFYSGTRKLLGKQIIHSLHIRNDLLLFAGGSSVDAVAGKPQNLGSLRFGLKETVRKVASIKVAGGGHAKITSLTSDINELMLFAASSDGRIQVWTLGLKVGLW
uniref:Uncharacterized protein n=1 Tax=Fagus sylvatica TaxID=28930 RepID=A0A2N9FFD1_FAGSY